MSKQEIDITVRGVLLKGDLVMPGAPQGLVIFSHGSGSSRFSPRNRAVAESLNREGFATLLFDLLTEEEDSIYENRFDIELLTNRLVEVTHWLKSNSSTALLPMGYFGASTGAASALRAAAVMGNGIQAVVSRGGRPDLAMKELPRVQAATLLIVGALDEPVITLNRQAFQQLKGEKQLQIVQGATHLFEEPGKLETVAAMAAAWYRQHLVKRSAAG